MALVLVGNKSDLDEERKVSFEEAQMKSRDLGCFMHIETSAWTDIDSINELFRRIADEIVRRKLFTEARGISIELPRKSDPEQPTPNKPRKRKLCSK